MMMNHGIHRTHGMVLLAVAMVLGAWADTWSDPDTGISWTYTVSNGEASLGRGTRNTAIPTSTCGALTIPSALDAYPVTRIGDRAFYNCTNLTSVTIPDSVTNIGNSAFYNCTNLTSVTIPDSVMKIGSTAFSSCPNLTSVYITDLAKWCGISVGGGALLEELLRSSFYRTHDLYLNGEKITALVIPDSVTSIGSGAFRGCDGLTSVTIPDSVLSIGSLAFRYCDGLTSVTIGNCVTDIGNYAFYYCSGLTEVTIPDSVTNIGSYAFCYCSGLTEVTIPDSVTNIGSYAFSYCRGLTEVTIPSSVTGIGTNAFLNAALTTVYVSKGDAERVKGMLSASGYDISGLSFLTIPVEIKNVAAKQRYPWNGLVDINFTITGDAGTKYDTSFMAKDMVGNTNIAMRTIRKADGTAANVEGEALYPGTYHWVWDAAADLPDRFECNRVIVTVKAEEDDSPKKVQLWDGGPYWAETNIGAENPWDCGYYFWWGDTIGYKFENNTWVASDGSSMNRPFGMRTSSPTYQNPISGLKSGGWITDDNVLVPEHDAAQVQWRGGWRIPTSQELTGLNNNCDWAWTTTNGVNGYVVRGRGNYASASIFLPVAGYGDEDGFNPNVSVLYGGGSYGYYWSSVPHSNPNCSYNLEIKSNSHVLNGEVSSSRYRGHTVRPVKGFAE